MLWESPLWWSARCKGLAMRTTLWESPQVGVCCEACVHLAGLADSWADSWQDWLTAASCSRTMYRACTSCWQPTHVLCSKHVKCVQQNC